MFENLKVLSKGLNTQFKVTVCLPFDYDKNDKMYKSVYIVASNNPFANYDLDLENKILDRNMIGIAIYPNIDVARNSLLFNSFDEKYDFARLYEEFIMNELNPLLEERYRISPQMTDRAILGLKDTSLLAYCLAYHYSNSFGVALMYDLHINHLKLFMSDLMSKFNPNIKFYFHCDDEGMAHEIFNRLTIFGMPDVMHLDKNMELFFSKLD